MKLRSDYHWGVLCVITSGLLYGFMGCMGLMIMRSGLSIYNILFWDFLISSVLMAFLTIPLHPYIAQNLYESLKIMLLGIIFYATSITVYFLSSQHLGSGLSMVTVFTYPAFVMLFNMIFYRSFNLRLFIAFVCIIIGMLQLVDATDYMANSIGLGLGLLSAFLYACYIVSNRNIAMPTTIATFMVMLGCTLFCFFVAIWDQSFQVPEALNLWGELLCLALFCTVLPMILFLQGLKYLHTDLAAMLCVFEPLCSVGAGVLLLGEQLNHIQILGGGIMLLGAFITLCSPRYFSVFYQ